LGGVLPKSGEPYLLQVEFSSILPMKIIERLNALIKLILKMLYLLLYRAFSSPFLVVFVIESSYYSKC
jgi:hypothetical protein